MSGYPWAMLLADRGGEALESLIATLLIARHPNARQVNPSQGDGGIDILLETPDRLVIWQVKCFAAPLSPSQWGQVKRSWKRFCTKYVEKGLAVAEYNLVTPWTPTEERYIEFGLLTAGAAFPTHWRGEAWLNLAADESPATMQRFQYGPNALEQYVNAKAQLAGNPVELSDSISTLEAIERREAALDDLRDLVSDHYSIRRSVIAAPTPGELPPIPEGPAAMHQFREGKNGDWIVDTVVPKSASAHELDPINISARFSLQEGSEDQKQLEAWLDWGTPFTNFAVQTRQTGGPFGSPEFANTLLSIVHPDERPDAVPPLTLVITDQHSRTKVRTPLTVESRTEGARTGWRHIVAVSKERTFKLDLRFKPGEVSMNITTLPLTGLDPIAVRDELWPLTQLDDGDLAAVLIPDGQPLIKPFPNFVLPEFMIEYGLPIANSLSILQGYTLETLRFPDIEDATLAEINALHRVASIYAGEPLNATWSRIGMRVPEDEAERASIMGVLSQLEDGNGLIVAVIHPEVKLAGLVFTIPHPLAEAREGARLEPGVTVDSLTPGQEFELLPDGVGMTTTAKVADWTPDSAL